MTKRVLACVALAVVSLVSLAHIGLALPDLAVASLEISPAAPTDGAQVTIAAVIENVGLHDVSDSFFVRFTVDHREIDVIPITNLRRGWTERLSTTWPATAGSHVLSVEIDRPFNRVEEADEENNAQSLSVDVRLSEAAMAVLAPLKVAVARFTDFSGTGFVNVGEGVADAVTDRLASTGLRVVDRADLDETMQANGWSPDEPANVAAASRLVGADLVVLGSVLGVDVHEASLSLGFFRVDSASAEVRLSAQIVDTRSSQTLSHISAEGQHEGTTGFSIGLGQLLSFLTVSPSEVCSGGLQLDRAWYNTGQTILAGYRNDGAPAWFGIEIYSSAGSLLRWLGWRFVGAGECETWFWDQRDAFGSPMNPGIYTAKLWDGTSYIAAAGFQIRPGVSLSIPAGDEITVGSSRFNETVVGTAMNQAVDRVTSALLAAMVDTASSAAERREAPAPLAASQATVAPREGQIASILPDGRIAINLGASSGVAVGDIFEVVAVENLVLDPQTREILGYDVAAIRGEARIIETRDKVSYAVFTGSVAPNVGDIVRSR